MISEEGIDLSSYSHPPCRRLSSVLCGGVCRPAGIVLVPRDCLPSQLSRFPNAPSSPLWRRHRELFQYFPRFFDFALKLLRGACRLTLCSSQFAMTQLGRNYCHIFLTSEPWVGFKYGPAAVTHTIPLRARITETLNTAPALW